MYFIPRNNAIYNYIAHTSSMRRYLATLFIVVFLALFFFYGISIPLNTYIAAYKAEIIRLQKQYEEMRLLGKSNKETLSLLDASKKNIGQHTVSDSDREKICSERMQWILDTIAQRGLILNSYGSCKEKDKKWYVKNSAHYQMTGSQEKILAFLKTIKEAQRLIALSHLSLRCIKDDQFQLNCDIGIITVKK